MNDLVLPVTDLDAAAASATRILTICNSISQNAWNTPSVTLPAQYHELVCDAMDVIAKCLRITRNPMVVDQNDRPAAVDLTIPSELQHVLSFIGGRSDGTLFVMSPRPNRMQFRIAPIDGDRTVYLLTQPILVEANSLMQIELTEVT